MFCGITRYFKLIVGSSFVYVVRLLASEVGVFVSNRNMATKENTAQLS